MDKYRIQIDWLNKLYDDIYYSELEDSEHGLDIISTLISDKEIKPITDADRNLASIVIEVSEELAELYDGEGLTDCYNFIIDKIEKIQNGDFDDAFKEEYFPELYDLEEDTEILDNEYDETYEDVESIDDDTYHEENLEEFDEEYDEEDY